jgi:predicted RecA/RadA family phage recombinase
MTIDAGSIDNFVGSTAILTNNATGAFQWSGSLVGKYARFQFTDNNSTGSTKKLITEARLWTYADDAHGTWKWQGSDSASGPWTDIGSSFLLSGTDAVAGEVGKLTSLSGNTTAYTYYQILGVSGVVQTGSTKWVALMEFEAADETITSNATGSFNSTDVVPQDATNKSSVGIVILYKDQAGTTTFNGANQLVAKVRANTGQAYQEVVLAGAGTYSDGLKIAIAPAIAVTAGQALSYEISFAGQSVSLETRVHGVAMTY